MQGNFTPAPGFLNVFLSGQVIGQSGILIAFNSSGQLVIGRDN